MFRHKSTATAIVLSAGADERTLIMKIKVRVVARHGKGEGEGIKLMCQ